MLEVPGGPLLFGGVAGHRMSAMPLGIDGHDTMLRQLLELLRQSSRDSGARDLVMLRRSSSNPPRFKA